MKIKSKLVVLLHDQIRHLSHGVSQYIVTWSFVRNLKGSGIGISNDFPKEIDEIHEKLYPILKKAKQERQSAYFKVDKLTINGQVYRGKETEDLLHYGAIM